MINMIEFGGIGPVRVRDIFPPCEAVVIDTRQFKNPSNKSSTDTLNRHDRRKFARYVYQVYKIVKRYPVAIPGAFGVIDRRES